MMTYIDFKNGLRFSLNEGGNWFNIHFDGSMPFFYMALGHYRVGFVRIWYLDGWHFQVEDTPKLNRIWHDARMKHDPEYRENHEHDTRR